MNDYWYNVRTHEIEKGPQSGWKELIGPYASQEEAEHALEKVRMNNEKADAAEEEDDY